MLDRLHHYLRLGLAWLRSLCRRLANWTRRVWRRLSRRRRIPIEVLVVDRARRRTLEREIRGGLARLSHALGDVFPTDTAVIVQHVLAADHPVAGCYQVGQRPDGRPFALVRLALQVNGRALTLDELLATLAEQCIGIATQQSGGLSVVVPVELEPAPLSPDHRPAPPRDPLAPAANGHRSITSQRSA